MKHPVNYPFPIDLQPKNNAKENVENFVIKMFAIWKKIEENVLEDFKNGKFTSHIIKSCGDFWKNSPNKILTGYCKHSWLLNNTYTTYSDCK